MRVRESAMKTHPTEDPVDNEGNITGDGLIGWVGRATVHLKQKESIEERR